MQLPARLLAFIGLAFLAQPAVAEQREPGFEFGLDVIHQDAQITGFDGGSQVRMQTDYGLSAYAGYRINSRFEVQWSFDWQDIDYTATLRSQSPLGASADLNGDLEAFTTRVIGNFNFLDRPLTPYITGAIGWTFVDTNIPEGPPQGFCWWDPWWGPICGAYQNTRSIDEFVYDLGVGARWDISSGFTVKLAYERHWVDFSEATSTPDFDQIKLGFVMRY